MKGYWDKHKQSMFPLIKDWTKPQNHIRKKNIHKQTQKEWFWFSTASYKMAYCGSNIISCSIFSLVIIYFVIRKVWPLAILLFVFNLILGIDLIRKLRNYKNNKYMTFYDLYLREY